jgi:hypothetical protein
MQSAACVEGNRAASLELQSDRTLLAACQRAAPPRRVGGYRMRSPRVKPARKPATSGTPCGGGQVAAVRSALR